MCSLAVSGIVALRVGVICVCVAPVVGCRNSISASAKPSMRTLRLVTSNSGASAYRLGTALSVAFQSAQSELRLHITESVGSIQNVQAIEAGDADVGFAFADVAYLAFSGHLNGRPFRRLSGIAVLQASPVHLIVGKSSGIHSATDLSRRRVGIGIPASGSSLIANLVLRAFGVDTRTVVFDETPAREAAHRTASGDLDALLVMATDPYDPITVVMRSGGRLLPVEGPAVDRLRRNAPFVHLTAIAPNTYVGQTTAVHTIAIDNVLLCRRDLDEDVVYELTKQFFDVLPSFAPSEASLRLIDLAWVDATPIPLHDGAARYYRERELSR